MKSLKQNYIYNIVGEYIVFFVPLILVPYTSRTLGPDNLGIYSYTFSIATVFSQMSRLGINTYGTLKISQHRDSLEDRSRIFWELMSLKVLLTAVEIAIYAVYVFLFSEYQKVSLIMIIYLVADMLDPTWAYQGVENYKLLAGISCTRHILQLSLILLLVHGHDDLYVYTFIIEGTTFVTNLSMWTVIGKYIKKPRFYLNANTLRHFKRCLVYFLPTIANVICNLLDRVMLGYIGHSTVESGYYEQSYRIITIAQSVVGTLGTVSLPRLTYLYASGEKEAFNSIVGRTMRFSMMLLIPMGAGLFFNAELIVRTVLGIRFLGAAGVLRVLGILIIFAPLNYNLGFSILVSTERQREFNIGAFSGAFLDFILNLILIRRYYAVGAAIGSLAAEMLIFVIHVAFSK